MCATMQSDIRPAGTAVWTDGSAGLALLDFVGACMDTELAAMPSGMVMAADVRLDEPDELAAKLGLHHDPAPSGAMGDALLVDAALARLGDSAAADAMLGDFALAAYDAKKAELLLMRDAMGVRPLVYHHVPGKYVLFASFPRAIHASGLLPRKLDVTAIVRKMQMLFVPDGTLSQGVAQLSPGHTVRLTQQGEHKKRYWQPAVQPRRHASPLEASAELRRLLERAVETRVKGSGPVAAHLSGGLDSSALCIMANRDLVKEGRKLYAYSFLSYPDDPTKEDETPYVRAVLAQEPEIDWMCVSLPTPEMKTDRERDADHLQSTHDMSPENVVCVDAARHGAQMVLSGWGGDEGATFNARGALADAVTHGRWLYAVREMRHLRSLRGFSYTRTLLAEVLYTLLSEEWVRRLQKLRGKPEGLELRIDPLPLLTPAMRARVQQQAEPVRLKTAASVRATQLRLLRSAHIAQRTVNWAQISARYGMAFSFPLLDRRVIEFALSLPPTWQMREGWKRRVFRDAMAGVLPELIRWRHGKLQPFPHARQQSARLWSEQTARFEVLAAVPQVREVFDTDAALTRLRALMLADKSVDDAELADIQEEILLGSVIEWSAYVANHVAD